MRPTSLSPEFYEKLYNEIINAEIDPEDTDDTQHYLDFNIDGFDIEVWATFEVNVIDDSFDHAFGTEYAYHIEAGEFTGLDEVFVYDEDGDDVSDLFDDDKFWDCDKVFGIHFSNGAEVKPGDEVMYQYNRYWFKGVYQYTDRQNGKHRCINKYGNPSYYKRVVTIAAYERAMSK